MTGARWWRPWRVIDDVGILHVDLAPDEEREERALLMLDDEERARSGRFLSAHARRQFVLCRAALRVTLSERLGCANHQLAFGYLEHGKPFALVDGQRAAIGFNVSHSGTQGLMAFATNAWLGVDVEERVSARDLEGIGSLVFGPAERRSLAIAAGRDRVELFYRLWSMKEALIKAVGAGFSLNPSRFEIPPPMLEGARSGTFRFPHARQTNGASWTWAKPASRPRSHIACRRRLQAQRPRGTLDPPAPAVKLQTTAVTVERETNHARQALCRHRRHGRHRPRHGAGAGRARRRGRPRRAERGQGR